jgi:type VI secretion system protein ImpA
MASAPLLNPDEFLAPISDANPAGRPLSIAEINQLKEYQEDFDPERDLSPQDRQNPQYAELQRKTPQWTAIIDFGTKFLKQTGKDLELVVRMVEALTKTPAGGFAGLRTGFRLVRRLCEDCWDRMHPIIEDPTNPDDVEYRTSKLNWLDEAEKKPYFPNSVRAVPILSLPDGREVSYVNCQQKAGGPPLVTREEFGQAVNSATPTDVERLREIDGDITGALNEIRELSAVLDTKAGGAATGFGAVRKALVDCQSMTQQALKMRAGDVAAAPTGGEAAAAQANGTAVAPSPVRNREEIYARLMQLIGMLEETDPHSPVPLLLRRAVELRGLKFPELVDTLTRDARVLDFLRGTSQ